MSDTLRILHLPPQLSNERRNELFQRYGATKTRTLRPSRKHTITFAKFPSREAATEALLRLHQLNIRGQRLSVEIAKQSILSETGEHETRQERSVNQEIRKELTSRSHFQAFLQKLNGWALNQVFSQPPPPNIRYKYAPPTRSTLIRIAMQLLKEPAFYTQVLHLMNKMNLPPPYSELESEFPMLKQIYNMEKYEDILSSELLGDKEDCRDFSTKEVKEREEGEGEEEEEEEESEIETDNENNSKPLEIVPMKRKRPQSTKRLKIPKFANPATQMLCLPTSTQNTVKPEDMFEQIERGETRNMKIELKVVNKILDGSRTTDSTIFNNATDGGFGLMFPASKSAETNDECHRREVITTKELADNRISVNDQRLLPVFKNYHPGKPSNRLYIKNLAKHVEEKDLHFIYRKYVISELKEAEFKYDVRLMQEGRMKGQAFVSLQNTTQAQLALEETNGYILKDKPMVVQFAKVPKS